jgi:hypothetical protein
MPEGCLIRSTGCAPSITAPPPGLPTPSPTTMLLLAPPLVPSPSTIGSTAAAAIRSGDPRDAAGFLPVRIWRRDFRTEPDLCGGGGGREANGDGGGGAGGGGGSGCGLGFGSTGWSRGERWIYTVRRSRVSTIYRCRVSSPARSRPVKTW